MNKLLLVAYFFLNFYLAGVFVIEIEVNYRTWLFIGVDDFPLYHRSLVKLLFPAMLVPLTFAGILSWLMVILPALKNYRRLFLIHAVLITAFSVISLTLMVPLHNQLSLAFDAEIIRQLIFRSAVFRLPFQVAMVAINLYLLFRFLGRGKY